MNILSIAHRGISARLFAAITIVSLLVSALPVAFFVAEAATGVIVMPAEAKNLDKDNQVYTSSITDASEYLNLKLDFDYDTETAGKNDTIYYGWQDGVLGTFHQLGEFKGKDEKDSKSGDEIGHISKSLPVDAEISNLIITIFEKDRKLEDDEVVKLTNIIVTGDEPKKVDICHWNGSSFDLLNVSVNSIGSAHGATGVNDGDIIPVIPDEYAGQNLDVNYNGKTGAEVLAANCVVPPQIKMGTIVIEKLTSTEGESVEFNFSGDLDDFSLNGNASTSFNVEVGEYSITEGATEGWDLVSISCNIDDEVVDGATVTLNLEADETIICQFANRAKEKPVVIENSCILPDALQSQETFTIGTSGEPSLATIFNNNGFGTIDVEDDQLNTQVWNFADVNTDTTTFTVKVLAKHAGNKQLFGYYEAGDAGSFTPLFKVGAHTAAVPELAVGSSTEVTIPNNASFGLALDTEGVNPTVWHSEFALNNDGVDNVAVYNPANNTYLVAFEDQKTGDRDFNDLVLQIDGVKCQTKERVATLHAAKIVCTDEADLPNYGNGGPDITATTATDWIGENHPSCQLVNDWEFEWAPNANYYNNDTLIGTAGAGWTKFTGSTTVPASVLKDGSFWVRELLQENYIPFTHNTDNGNNYSAEIYCHNDVLNYDNLDAVRGAEVGGDYYCVAWNVPVDTPPEQCTIVSDTNTLVVDNNDYAVLTYEHKNWTAAIPGADWIWDTYYSADSGDLDFDIVRTFEETFNVTDPQSAILDVAADNGYVVYINGNLVLDRSLPTYENNFQPHTFKQGVDVLSYLVSGENTMRIVVTNKGVEGSNSMSNPAGLLYKLVIESDNECEITTEPEKPLTYIIDGHKYETEGEGGTPVAGWTINLTDDEGTVLMSTTTDQNGYYFFNVEIGEYQVHEVMQDDWSQDWVDADGGWTGEEEVNYCEFEIGGYKYDDRVSRVSRLFSQDYDSESGYSCDFYNTYTEPEDEEEEEHIITGTKVKRQQGRVLGASTTVCPFLEDFMQMGIENDSWEVTKLQLFLNIFVAPTPVTGFFGPITDTNVKLFQEKYRSEVLNPWHDLGIVPHNEATGFVYKTTLWKINSIICPDYAILPNYDGEDLTQNIDID